MNLKNLWTPEPVPQEINVLVAESDPEVMRAAEMCCQTDKFKVKTVNTLVGLQQELDEALRGESKIDLLILDPILANGSAQPVLRQWAKWYSNPMIIITSDRLSDRDREELFLQGAWSVLDYVSAYNVLGRQVRRFGRFVQNERRTLHLEKEVVSLRRYVIVLLVATAAALGEGLIPWVVNMFTTLSGG